MARTEKKKMSKGTKTLFIVVCVLVGLALLLAATVFTLSYIGRSSLTGDDTMKLPENADTGFESLGSGTIRRNGKLYRYNDEITCILLMGIDSYDKQSDGNYAPHQSDVNVLAVIDPKNEKLTLLSVSRDTLCELDIVDENGNMPGTAEAQLALAYNYGGSDDESCRLTATAVSRIFYGLNIPAYASIYMNGISDLVDIVGGVTVTPSDNFNGFAAGKQVELKGNLTERYIRFRDYSVDGNNKRMQRQNQVLKALVYKALSVAKSDPTSVLDIYSSVQDNVTTNINTAMMIYLARQAVDLKYDGQILTVPGHSEMGEQDHAVFVIDEEAFLDQIIEIFYDQVKNEIPS